MRGVKDRHSDITCLSIVCVYFIFISIVLPFTYGTNDDMSMRDIASGALSGTPDGHLIFVQYALGKVLSCCYSAVHGIDWYAVIWIGLILFCFLLLLSRIRRLCIKKEINLFAGTAVSLVLFTLIYIEHYVNFQFTVVSAVTGGTAILYYYTIDSEQGLRQRLRDYMIVMILLWLTYCIRSSVFIMAVPFGGFMFLFKRGIPIKEKLMILSLSIAGLVLIFLIENHAYSSQEWKNYKEYNVARSEIYDYYGVPNYEENKEFYDSVGMEECDAINLERYSLYFIDGIETEKMFQVAEYAENQWKELQTFPQRIKNGIKTAIKGFFSIENLLLNGLVKIFFLYVLFLEWKKKEKEFFLSCMLLAAEGVLWLYLGYEGRLPDRVGAALLLVQLSCSLALLYQNLLEDKKKIPKMKSRWVILGAAVLTAVCVLKLNGVREDRMEIFQNNKQLENFNDWFAQHGENVYFYPVDFTAGYTENVKIFRDFEVSNGFPLGGWLSFSPIKEEGLKCFGIIDVDKAILDQDNIYLVMVHPSSRIDQHYDQMNIDVSWTQVDTVPFAYMEISAWKIAEKE